MCCLKGVNSKQIPGAKFCFLTLIPNIIEEEDLSYFFCSALWGPRELFLDESLVKYIYSQDKSPFTHVEARLFPHSAMIWQYSHPTLQLPAPTFPGCPISKVGSPNSSCYCLPSICGPATWSRFESMGKRSVKSISPAPTKWGCCHWATEGSHVLQLQQSLSKKMFPWVPDPELGLGCVYLQVNWLRLGRTEGGKEQAEQTPSWKRRKQHLALSVSFGPCAW